MRCSPRPWRPRPRPRRPRRPPPGRGKDIAALRRSISAADDVEVLPPPAPAGPAADPRRARARADARHARGARARAGGR